MKKLFLIQCLLLSFFSAFSQNFDSGVLNNSTLKDRILKISQDKAITADSAWTILTSFKTFPDIQKTKQDYLFIYKDSLYGDVPFKVYIPENYKSNVANPLVILLHGEVGRGRFADAYNKNDNPLGENDIFFESLLKTGFIIVRPFGDPEKKFDWVVNRFKTKNNQTFNTLVNTLIQLKHFLNIDDNKIFAFGHSDGSDGAFALDVYKATSFAGFVSYNSMLTNIFAQDIYLNNTLNRPYYLVHSDLDDLRPIQQTRKQVQIFDSIGTPILYKEYIGYQHYDKHLQKDMPFSNSFLNAISRNPFQKNIYWETEDYYNSGCDWIKITSFDTTLNNASWHLPLNMRSYNKIKKEWENYDYYPNLQSSAAIKASYNNNIFKLFTSRVKEVEVLISPVMVNLENPVTIIINGKTAFKGKIIADKNFLLNNFSASFDRKELWVNSVKLNVQ